MMKECKPGYCSDARLDSALKAVREKNFEKRSVAYCSDFNIDQALRNRQEVEDKKES
jgi:hypothetical protein